MTCHAGRNPYVFIVGCPRSGTTLLRRMLDEHPQVAITPETHWIPRHLERGVGVTPEGFATPVLVTAIAGSPKFRRTGIGRVELESLLGTKLFPEARFVHLIRDGRDVALSAIGWRRASKLAERLSTWNADPVPTAAFWWERHVRSGREAAESLDSNVFHEVRYEALIADPAVEAESLCTFLDLPYDESMLRFHEGRRRSEPGLSAKKAWLPPTPGLRDWGAEMSAENVEQFEAMAGDLLDELNYPRAVPEPSAEAFKLAEEIRRALVEHGGTRERTVAGGQKA